MEGSQITTPLKALLVSRGFGAQSELARSLRMGEAQLSKYVTGSQVPSVAARKKIAKRLRVEVEELWP